MTPKQIEQINQVWDEVQHWPDTHAEDYGFISNLRNREVGEPLDGNVASELDSLWHLKDQYNG